MRVWTLAALAASCCGCSLGLLQTGKTVPAGNVAVTGGGAFIDNARFADVGRPNYSTAPAESLYPVGGVRVGVHDRVDVAVTGALAPGADGEVKVALLPQEERAAVAVRAGGGYGVSDSFRVAQGHVGVVGSYDVAAAFVPYAGATLANHWISSKDAIPDLAPNERRASHRASGDGLMQLALGVAVGKGRVQALLEYDRWEPVWRDPGSGYHFVGTNVFLAGVRVCSCL